MAREHRDHRAAERRERGRAIAPTREHRHGHPRPPRRAEGLDLGSWATAQAGRVMRRGHLSLGGSERKGIAGGEEVGLTVVVGAERLDAQAIARPDGGQEVVEEHVDGQGLVGD